MELTLPADELVTGKVLICQYMQLLSLVKLDELVTGKVLICQYMQLLSLVKLVCVYESKYIHTYIPVVVVVDIGYFTAA